MATRLILLRHGETDYSAKNRYCSFTDIGLNRNGILQFKKLARRLRKISLDSIYSSDMKRAYHSANLIFGSKGLPIKQIPNLREMNFGAWEGLTHKEIIKEYKSVYDEWIRNPYEITIPLGESLVSLEMRVKKELFKILNTNKNKTVAIVTHSGPIRVFLCNALGMELKNFWKIKQDLSALNIIEYYDDKACVCLLNDTCHLDGLKTKKR